MTVLGFGDSISEGPGDSALGVLPRPWAHWLALALDVPYHSLALPGATAASARAELLPRLRGPYSLACVGLGVNDARACWDATRFAADFAAILQAIDADRLCVTTVPHDLGRPRCRAASHASALVRALASEHGAVVVDVDDLRGWLRVMPDCVHPTAVGQLEIADRAAAALGLGVRPSSLADVHRSARSRLRYAMTRHAPMLARDLRRRVVERAAYRAGRRAS
jgi:hypothetical protein